MIKYNTINTIKRIKTGKSNLARKNRAETIMTGPIIASRRVPVGSLTKCKKSNTIPMAISTFIIFRNDLSNQISLAE